MLTIVLMIHLRIPGLAIDLRNAHATANDRNAGFIVRSAVFQAGRLRREDHATRRRPPL
jgi:hypothetical protein